MTTPAVLPTEPPLDTSASRLALATPDPSSIEAQNAVGGGGGTLAETEAKLQRLVQEYTKIKAQNTVLKKAVLQEQEKSRALEGKIEEKERQHRAQMEEIDRLQFNNQRLTKRLEQVLHDTETRDKRASEGSSWFGGASKAQVQKLNEALAVSEEHLQSKIRENENVHLQAYEDRRKFEEQVKTLTGRLNLLMEEHDRASNLLQTQTSQLTTATSQLADAKEDIKSLRENLTTALEEGTRKETTFTREREELSKELTQLRAKFLRKVPFDDTASETQSFLNLPGFDRSDEIRMERAVSEGSVAFGLILQAYRDHVTAYCARLRVKGALSKEFSSVAEQVMLMMPRALRPMEDAAASLATLKSIGPSRPGWEPALFEVRGALARLVQHHKQLLPYQLTCLRLEYANSPTGSHLPDLVNALSSAYAAVVSSLDRALGLWSTAPPATSGDPTSAASRNAALAVALASPRVRSASTSTGAHGNTAHSAVAPLVTALASLVQSHSELLTRQRALMEADGSAATGEGEGLLATLTRYVDAISNLSQVTSASHAAPPEGWTVSVRGAEPISSEFVRTAVRPAVAHLESRARDFLSKLRNDCQPSLSYDEAVALKVQAAQHGGIVDGLTRELNALKESVATLTREKVSLEAQIAELQNGARTSSATHQIQVESLRRALDAANGELLAGQKQLGALRELHALCGKPVVAPAEDGEEKQGAMDPLQPNPAVEAAERYYAAELDAAQARSAALEVAVIAAQEEVAHLQARLAGMTAGHLLKATIDAQNSPMPVVEVETTEGSAEARGKVEADGAPVSPAPDASPSETGRGRAREIRAPLYSLRVVNKGTGAVETKLTCSEEEQQREAMLKKHYETKIAQVTARLKAVDAKAVILHGEQTRAQQEVRELRERLTEQGAEVTAALDAAARARSDLQSTQRNYENQLNLMTEHVVTMNAEVTKARDIQKHVSGCSTCKSCPVMGTGKKRGK